MCKDNKKFVITKKNVYFSASHSMRIFHGGINEKVAKR